MVVFDKPCLARSLMCAMIFGTIDATCWILNTSIWSLMLDFGCVLESPLWSDGLPAPEVLSS
jgi:hypothetical protein